MNRLFRISMNNFQCGINNNNAFSEHKKKNISQPGTIVKYLFLFFSNTFSRNGLLQIFWMLYLKENLGHILEIFEKYCTLK